MPKLLIEKVQDGATLKPGDIVEVSDGAASDLMASGIVFSVAEPSAAVTASASPASRADLSLLDQSIADLAACVEGLPEHELTELLAAEHIGKTRKGAIEVLEAEMAKSQEVTE